MQLHKIKLHEYYRHKNHPDFCWARPIAVLKPKEKENTTNKTVLKCEWTTHKNSKLGLIKYFSPGVLIEESK